jgi:drug/metabolite transporter (DMT)-like permease
LTLLALLGVVGNQSLLLLGLKYTSPVSAALMQLLVPIIGTFLSVVVGEEKLDLCSKIGAGKVLGMLTSIAGAVVLILGDNISGSYSGKVTDLMICHLLYFGNAACYAGFIVFMKPSLKKYPASRVIFWTLLIGSVLMLFVCIPDLNASAWASVDKTVWGCFIYCGIVASCIAFCIMSWANHRTSSVVVSAFSSLLPLATATLSFIFLSVSLNWRDYLGAALLIIGLFVLCYAKHLDTQSQLKDYLQISPKDGKEKGLLGQEDYMDEYYVREQDFESAHSAS